MIVGPVGRRQNPPFRSLSSYRMDIGRGARRRRVGGGGGGRRKQGKSVFWTGGGKCICCASALRPWSLPSQSHPLLKHLNLTPPNVIYAPIFSIHIFPKVVLLVRVDCAESAPPTSRRKLKGRTVFPFEIRSIKKPAAFLVTARAELLPLRYRFDLTTPFV